MNGQKCHKYLMADITEWLKIAQERTLVVSAFGQVGELNESLNSPRKHGDKSPLLSNKAI